MIAEIATVKADLTAEIATVKADLSGEVAVIRDDLRRMDDRLRAVEIAFGKVEQRLETLERLPPAGSRRRRVGQSLQARIDAQGQSLRARIEAQGKDLRERMDAQGGQMNLLPERMAHLEGLREAITGKGDAADDGLLRQRCRHPQRPQQLPPGPTSSGANRRRAPCVRLRA